LDLVAVLKALGARGVEHVMVEGGPVTARAFLAMSLVDRSRNTLATH
jgi:riboflavin biosynthesis pyrimidine reductase